MLHRFFSETLYLSEFPEDKYVDRCVILPPAAGEFKSTKRNIVNRMVNVSPRLKNGFFKIVILCREKIITTIAQQT